MQNITPSLNMVNAEFTNAPLGTTVALITILALLIKPAIKIANRIFTYKKGHSEILKKGGVPAFMLNFFIISIPLKKLPAIGKPEKVITFVFFIILLLASWFLIPALIQTLRTPPDSTLLIWKESGKPFYISEKKASEATTFLPSSWSVTVEECRQNTLSATESQGVISARNRQDLCTLLTTAEGQSHLENAIAKFNKEKLFVTSMIPFTLAVILWLLLGFIFTIYYTKKVRKFILMEQKKAIYCAHGDFSATGVYAIYQEIE
ncbi:DUF6216 family protein [Erwinia sp. S43]|uniref:DUF6216 family protein n=1 Tax=Erwinia sp. S43 TaxID=2769339 RepID=UPI001F27B8FB|nr:DUF6216 family protein [Erwinia sp. S43]